MEEHPTEYSQITDQIYIGSNLCVGPHCPVHCEYFKKLGITGEVNLEMERDENPSPCVEAYLWLPVLDNTAPTPSQLEIGASVMDGLIKAGGKVYVHCQKGHGRSPTLVCAYLVKYGGMKVEDAMSFVWQKRREIHLEEVQVQALKEFEEEVRKGS